MKRATWSRRTGTRAISGSGELAVTSIASSNLSSVSLLTGTIPKPQRTIRSCASRTTERGTCFVAGRTTTSAGCCIWRSRVYHFDVPATQKRAQRNQITRKLAISKFATWILSFCHIRVLAMGNSIKEAISIMKPKQIFISILAVLFVFPLMGTFAQQAANSGSIEVITTFDYPGAGNNTLPQKINESGDVVGVFVSSGVTRAFVRFSDGSFSAPIVDPNDTAGFTEGRGINNSRTVNGDYVGSGGNLHGFVLSSGTFTDFTFPGTLQTTLLSINDPGDFTGDFADGSGIFPAWFSVGGNITSFSVPGALSTVAYETNNN